MTCYMVPLTNKVDFDRPDTNLLWAREFWGVPVGKDIVGHAGAKPRFAHFFFRKNVSILSSSTSQEFSVSAALVGEWEAGNSGRRRAE